MPEGGELLQEWARLSYDDLRAEAENHVDLTDPHESARMWREGIDFVATVLGEEWLERELDERRRGGYLMLDGPVEEDDPADRSLRENRLFDLAVELHEARWIKGFEHLVKELRTRSLFEAVAELRAANHMSRAGQSVWFHDPNAQDGKSYDATVVLSGQQVAVEVKTKAEKAVNAYRPRLIQNTLGHARKQLPATGPSMIYLQLSSPWTDDAGVLKSVDETIRHFLRNTKRVNAVVLMLERRFRHQVGLSVTRGTLTLPNPHPHQPVLDLQGW